MSVQTAITGMMTVSPPLLMRSRALTAWGLTEDTLRRVAENLRAAGSDEIEQLLTNNPACPQNGLWTHC